MSFAVSKLHKFWTFHTIRSYINLVSEQTRTRCYRRLHIPLLGENIKFFLSGEVPPGPHYMTSVRRRQGERVLLEEIAVSAYRTQR